MFFVAKDKIGTTLGAQKEFAACTRRGINFISAAIAAKPGHFVWHYMWPADMVEPSIRARFEPAHPVQNPPSDVEDDVYGAEPDVYRRSAEPNHFLWSQEVAHGEVVGDPLITPYSGAGDWTVEAKEKFATAQAAALDS